MSKMEELEAEARRIESMIINESELERRRRAAEYEQRRREEDARLKREMEESRRQTALALERKTQEDRLAEERSRAEYSTRANHILSLLPDSETMPVCQDCGARLQFSSLKYGVEAPEITIRHDYANSAPYGVTTLRCPNGCGSQLARFQSKVFPLRFE
jgi:hypothetical protein